jgi:hypothetical protein
MKTLLRIIASLMLIILVLVGLTGVILSGHNGPMFWALSLLYLSIAVGVCGARWSIPSLLTALYLLCAPIILKTNYSHPILSFAELFGGPLWLSTASLLAWFSMRPSKESTRIT